MRGHSLDSEDLMIGSLIGWIILGLVAGLLARMLHSGRDGMGLISTIALVVLGSLIGGDLACLLRLGTSPYEPGGDGYSPPWARSFSWPEAGSALVPGCRYDEPGMRIAWHDTVVQTALTH
jgi:uncharacterized membrane protein YeaQ/YmgE (transglycosylase-associated protein family)